MISTKDIYQLRLKPFVEKEISEDKDHVYLDKHNKKEWLSHILAEMMEYLSFEPFITMTDEELRKLVGKRMATELVTGMLNDFSPEQMKIFNECLVRR
ncbi:hypothetical protein PN36_27860 [Candidatus Thiomargarita nelsonii]|uniref:Uncharacterized protein n=1 Tax=Candidatus Thiomargarita nelsonii TaxID=1003181 RepID=A0A0A6P3F5_9GAMM|nr:hypothetical protein PN36_27860 [Candidatus Thiomargarita nelsonii]